jgi:pimeloyl-ACP methyl ester carboxylesterase
MLGDPGRALAGMPHETAPLPPGCEEGYLTANGIRLHYVAAGAGPLTLLLHGFPEFWYSWRAQLPALAAAGRRAVALDLRGYNLSEKPSYGYDVATLSADIREVIGALGEREADVIGHDWGGMIAWVVALREPDYLRRLAIINAPHPATIVRDLVRNPRQLRRSSYIGLFQLRGVAEEAIRRRDYALLRRTFRAADRGHAWLTDDDIQRFVDAAARPGVLTAALEYYRQLVRKGPTPLSPMRVILSPTLVLWGELDPYMGPELLKGLDPWVRHLTLQRFPTAGHWLNQQEPERVNEALAAFLS